MARDSAVSAGQLARLRRGQTFDQLFHSCPARCRDVREILAEPWRVIACRMRVGNWIIPYRHKLRGALLEHIRLRQYAVTSKGYPMHDESFPDLGVKYFFRDLHFG